MCIASGDPLDDRLRWIFEVFNNATYEFGAGEPFDKPPRNNNNNTGGFDDAQQFGFDGNANGMGFAMGNANANANANASDNDNGTLWSPAASGVNVFGGDPNSNSNSTRLGQKAEEPEEPFKQPPPAELPLRIDNLFEVLDFVVRALKKLGGVHRPVSKFELQQLATQVWSCFRSV